MCNIVHLFGNLSWHNNNSILISNDGVTWAYNYPATINNSIAFPRLHSSRSLTSRSRMSKTSKPISNNFIRITNRSIRNKTVQLALHKTKKLNIPTHTFPRSNGGHDEYLIRTAKFKGFVFRTFTTRWFILHNVRSRRYKVQSYSSSTHRHILSDGTTAIDLGIGPTHDPQSIHKSLSRKTTKLLQKLIIHITTRSRSGGHRTSCQRGETTGDGSSEGTGKHV
mmetsp:Transcript_13002/g.16986  ORF Transcript_13002/g.16986 Transcript_13002/m.16986 type:complete len:223 (-) Transcript_13002:239-907(-)